MPDGHEGFALPVASAKVFQWLASDECESCGAPAEVELPDGSKWCASCDVAARAHEPLTLVEGDDG